MYFLLQMIDLVEALDNLLVDNLDLRLDTGLLVIRVAVRGVVARCRVVYCGCGGGAHFSETLAC